VFVPGADADDDADVRADCELLASKIPFAVIGSTEIHIKGGGGVKVRGRRYGWGVAEVDNEGHCDFALLRRMLVKTHLQDLKGMTEEVHYERFRKQMLEKGGVPSSVAAAMSASSSTSTVSSTDPGSRSAEEELNRRHEQMKRDLEEQAR
jgi:septin 7